MADKPSTGSRAVLDMISSGGSRGGDGNGGLNALHVMANAFFTSTKRNSTLIAKFAKRNDFLRRVFGGRSGPCHNFDHSRQSCLGQTYEVI